MTPRRSVVGSIADRCDDEGVTGLTDGMTAVVFDFYGTLTPSSPAEAWASNARLLAGVLGVDAEPLIQVLDETFPERVSGALGDARETMLAIAGRLGVRLGPGQLEQAIEVRRAAQEAMLELRAEALDVIAALRAAGLRTGLVSDCTHELPAAWPGLAVSALIDAPVFSWVERTRKPDPRLFRKVAADLRTEPAACVYVGDGGGNELTGSSAVGMRAVLLAGPDWHEHRDPRREMSWTGERISSLTELLG